MRKRKKYYNKNKAVLTVLTVLTLLAGLYYLNQEGFLFASGFPFEDYAYGVRRIEMPATSITTMTLGSDNGAMHNYQPFAFTMSDTDSILAVKDRPLPQSGGRECWGLVTDYVPEKTILKSLGESYCNVGVENIDYDKSYCTVTGILRVDNVGNGCRGYTDEVTRQGEIIWAYPTGTTAYKHITCLLREGLVYPETGVTCYDGWKSTVGHFHGGRGVTSLSPIYSMDVSFTIIMKSSEPEEPDEPEPSEPETPEEPEINCEDYGYTTTSPSCTSGTPLKVTIEGLQCYDGCTQVTDTQKATCEDYGYTLNAPACLFGIKAITTDGLTCYDGCKPAPFEGGYTESVNVQIDYTWLVIIGLVIGFIVIGYFIMKPKRKPQNRRR